MKFFSAFQRTGWRGHAERWWRDLSDGQRVFAPICFLNVVVFLGWRIPALKGTMLRYFCANPSSSKSIVKNSENSRLWSII